MLFEQNDAPVAPWSVADLTQYIRELFEIDFRLKDVEVQGEISNFTRARSGHLYFTLKDADAQLKCVMWRSQADRLRFRPQDGDAITARGHISVYPASGVYQLYASHLKPAGQGDLARQFELLKQRLAGEGLFDETYKKPLPGFPQKIGIVTSADAAALRDILNVLGRRYPLASVLIAPTLVQGDTAPSGIVRAVQWLDGRDDIDVIIVARGGGSMEDLWAFNDEMVARAIFAARHPVISGVGHEVDFTIADFVADVRAPTPSAAAELATPDVSELLPALNGTQRYLADLMHGRLRQWQQQVDALGRTARSLNPKARVQNQSQHVDTLTLRLDQAMRRLLTAHHNELALLRTQLHAVSPQATLARGYAIVRGENGLIRSVNDINSNDTLKIQVADGEFDATAV